MYEAVATGFVLMCIITGKLSGIGTYLLGAANTYLLFSIAAFIAFSLVLERSGIISDMINIIIAIVGRFSGGAGYVALVGTSAMGALCGTAPGCAAAVGVISIPAMKKSGFSPELAATVEMAASAMGPVIPPAGAITIIYSIIEVLYPGRYTFSQFWLHAWVISFWFLLQRFVTLLFIIKKQKIAPIPASERPSLRAAVKSGWRSLLLPVIIFVPFLVDALCKDSFITARLGSAAGAFTNILLVVIPSVAALYSVAVFRRGGGRFGLKEYFGLFKDSASSISPIIIMAYAGFAITELFNDVGIVQQLGASLANIHFSVWFVVVVIPLVFTVLGMFIEPVSLIVLFGSLFISTAASVGIHPMLAGMILDVMTCGLACMTPPFALSLFVCMGIAESDYRKTSRSAVIWCAGQYLLIVLALFGVLPMFGTLV